MEKKYKDLKKQMLKNKELLWFVIGFFTALFIISTWKILILLGVGFWIGFLINKKQKNKKENYINK